MKQLLLFKIRRGPPPGPRERAAYYERRLIRLLKRTGVAKHKDASGSYRHAIRKAIRHPSSNFVREEAKVWRKLGGKDVSRATDLFLKSCREAVLWELETYRSLTGGSGQQMLSA